MNLSKYQFSASWCVKEVGCIKCNSKIEELQLIIAEHEKKVHKGPYGQVG